MKGIRYRKDKEGNPVSVTLDLRQHKKVWDLFLEFMKNKDWNDSETIDRELVLQKIKQLEDKLETRRLIEEIENLAQEND